MSVPALFQGLFDDAAIFPPGDMPLDEAVPAHLAHRAAPYADAVGAFLCGAGRVGELARPAGPTFRVGLVLPGGSSQLAPALAAAAGLEIAGVEVAATDVRETVAAPDKELPEGVPAAVELPRGAHLEDSLDALTGTPYRAKFRTGGLAAEAFPSVGELAAFVAGCAERGLPYKCTAGLHNAVRHTDPATGFEHHGFLNVLLAADRPDHAAEILAERNGTVLADAARELTESQIAAIRHSFTAFGTCSIAEPLADLTGLGLLNLENR